MKLVVVANQKGGEGKTTVAVNLAAQLAASQRVLVVDLDPQGSVAHWNAAAERANRPLPFDTTATSDAGVLPRLRGAAYDWVIVDSPGKLGADATAAAVAVADFVVLPTTSVAPVTLMPLLETIDRLVKPAGIPYAVVLNRLDPRASNDGAEAETAFEKLNIPYFKTTVRSYKAHQTASGSGLTSYDFAKTRSEAKAALDFTNLATEIKERLNAQN